MISSARCIQARASIVSCPTVRMPVPTITSAPALLASFVMPHPTGGNTAAAPPIAAVDTRTAAETLGVSPFVGAGESVRFGAWGSVRFVGARDSVRFAGAREAVRFGESPGPVALPLAGRRPSPRHRSLGRSYLLPKGSQRTKRVRGCAGIHRASVDQSQDLTRTLSDQSP